MSALRGHRALHADEREIVIFRLVLSDRRRGAAWERRKWRLLEALLWAWLFLWAGEVDGHSIGRGEYDIFVYTRRSTLLFALSRPLVLLFAPRAGSYAELGSTDNPDERRIVPLSRS